MERCTVAELKAKVGRFVERSKTGKAEAIITKHGKAQALMVMVPLSEEDIEWTAKGSVRARLRRALDERRSGKLIRGADL